MRYSSGGYSWLGLAPESDFEKKIETIEDEIFHLKAEYEKSHDSSTGNKIKNLEIKLKKLKDSITQNNSH